MMASSPARKIAAVVSLLIAAAVVVPPFVNVNRYKNRITESMSNAVGRPVKIGSISLRVLPQPGFNLASVVIADDPAISGEPILRADEVTAHLRLTSMWRGRLEIAKLSLKYPSLNMVRGNDGHWNIESLLWRAARTSTAPTSARHAETTRVRFPYIEAENGRINFKFGIEKSPFSFTNADFSLWSPAENEWRMRLESTPLRTDEPISDTGLVKAEFNFRRATMLRDIPLQGKVHWERAQLGQLTKLANGHDSGWRGGMELSAAISGTPAELHFQTSTTVRDFRRYDIFTGDPIQIGAQCQGIASVPDDALTGFTCNSTQDAGSIAIKGSLGEQGKKYDISIAFENVPVTQFSRIAKHIKRGLPEDLKSTGMARAALNFRRNGPADNSPNWNGTGAITGLQFQSSTLEEPFTVGDIQFALHAPYKTEKTVAVVKLNPRQKKKSAPQLSLEPNEFLSIAPFDLKLSPSGPASVSAAITTNGYDFRIKGPVSIDRATQIARALGVSTPKIHWSGDAAANVTIGGLWAGLSRPAVTGTASLKKTQIEVPGIAAPVQISAADVLFSANQFRLNGISGSVGKISFSGAAMLPNTCEENQPCSPKLMLQVDSLNLDDLNALLNPNMKKRPWYKLLGSGREQSVLAHLDAEGSVIARQLVVGKLNASRVSADFRLHESELQLNNLRGDVLGGTQRGEWRIDFAGDSPVCTATGAFERVNVAQLSQLSRQPFGTGSISAKYEWKMQGWTQSELGNSSTGLLNFEWTNGAMRSVTLNGSPLRISRFTGRATYEKSQLKLTESKMQSVSSIYGVTGSATSGFDLSLEFGAHNGSIIKVTGPLQKPVVVVAPQEARRAQASLKQ